MSRSVLISGCSGGGKSTVLTTLEALGHPVVSEPGRRVIAAGSATPWDDMAGFARAALEMARQDLVKAQTREGWVFFDRGLIDAAVALTHCTATPLEEHLPGPRAYHHTVFLAPPWPEIYQNDPERQHSFEDALAEYQRLCAAFADLGYSTVDLPKTSPADRAAFILAQLS